MTAVKILDKIDNRIGTFLGASRVPSPGTSKAVLTADLPITEIRDSSDTLRLGIQAEVESGWHDVAWSNEWTGGPTQVVPRLEWQYDSSHPPKRVRGVLENITQVIVNQLNLDFQ